MLSRSTRLSALEPTSTRISSANELDYLEIFDFFNYPRSADHGSAAPYEIEQHLLGYESGSASLSMGVEMPTVESDWLQYETQ